jgi:hypothetical protein
MTGGPVFDEILARQRADTITLPRHIVDAVLRECLDLCSTQDAADSAMVDLLHAVRDTDRVAVDVTGSEERFRAEPDYPKCSECGGTGGTWDAGCPLPCPTCDGTGDDRTEERFCLLEAERDRLATQVAMADRVYGAAKALIDGDVTNSRLAMLGHTLRGYALQRGSLLKLRDDD